MRITENFNLEEFACKDGTPYPEKWIAKRLFPLCKDLLKIRALTGQPLIIKSGYRHKSYNRKVGGARNSQHINGIAADLVLKGMSKLQLYKAICQLISFGTIKEGGVGLYNTHVHYDRRGKRARWNKSKWRL